MCTISTNAKNFVCKKRLGDEITGEDWRQLGYGQVRALCLALSAFSLGKQAYFVQCSLLNFKKKQFPESIAVYRKTEVSKGIA